MLSREAFIRHINRKDWWHVPPLDPNAYKKRGQFLSSSFGEAEFYGRPLSEPLRVKVANPVIGDEKQIEKKLLGRATAHAEMSVRKRFALDARLKRSAAWRGYDAIALMAPSSYKKYLRSGRIPRSIELNIFLPRAPECLNRTPVPTVVSA